MTASVLVIDSGARGHALAWKLAQSPSVGQVYCCPGNGGTETVGRNISVRPDDQEALVRFARNYHIDLTVVGPEDMLAAGIVDRFQREGLRVFGPSKLAARIETSKAFAKHLMRQERIPTADFETFLDFAAATHYVRAHGAPIVVKADGLSAGKGAFVCRTIEQAEQALRDLMIRHSLGDAGDQVIIEDFLDGPEVSVHALCDGEHSLLLPCAQDHKAVFDGGQGPNTGGMGTYAPLPFVTPDIIKTIRKKIVLPTLRGLDFRHSKFQGCLFPGLKLTPEGPKVLEFNARPGDPETQSYMRLLKSDLYELLSACVDGQLDTYRPTWGDGYAVCVVIASGGYPGQYAKGLPISGLDDAERVSGVKVFHAGTRRVCGTVLTAGGRVLSVTARGKTLQGAFDRAYEAVRRIHFANMHYRTDIGIDAITSVSSP